MALGSLTLGLAGAVLVLILGIWHWERIQVLAGGYLVGVVVSVSIGAMIYSKKPGHAIIAFVCTLLTGSLLVTWHLPETRAQIIAGIGRYLPSHTLLLGLGDSDETVVAQACQSLVKKGYGEVQHLTPDFAKRPTSSITCLSKDIQGTDADELLRRDLSRLWEKEVLENPKATCGAVDAYAKMAPRIYSDFPARLLHLSFASNSIEAVACARKAFNDAYPPGDERLEGLGNPGDVDFKVAAPLFDELIQAGYSSTAIEADKEMMSDPMLVQWTMSLGCSLLTEGDDVTRTIRSLNQAMASSNCGAATGENSAGIWANTCEEAVDPETGFATEEKMCELIGTYARGEAISYAKTIVMSGVELMQWRAMQEKVEEGFAHRSGSAYDQRFVPADLMEATLTEGGLPIGVTHDLGYGFSSVRRYGGGARSAMQSGSVKTSASKTALEVFVAMGESGSFNGTSVDELFKDTEASPKDVFSSSNMKDAKELLKKKEEEEEEEEFAFEDLFGEEDDEKAMAAGMKNKRKQRQKEAKEDTEPEVKPWDQKK